MGGGMLPLVVVKRAREPFLCPSHLLLGVVVYWLVTRRPGLQRGATKAQLIGARSKQRYEWSGRESEGGEHAREGELEEPLFLCDSPRSPARWSSSSSTSTHSRVASGGGHRNLSSPSSLASPSGGGTGARSSSSSFFGPPFSPPPALPRRAARARGNFTRVDEKKRGSPLSALRRWLRLSRALEEKSLSLACG